MASGTFYDMHPTSVIVDFKWIEQLVHHLHELSRLRSFIPRTKL